MASGVRHSLRTLAEAQNLVRTSEAWAGWSAAEREARNCRAGTRRLGL